MLRGASNGLPTRLILRNSGCFRRWFLRECLWTTSPRQQIRRSCASSEVVSSVPSLFESESSSSLPSSSSSWKGRTASFSWERIEALIQRTNEFASIQQEYHWDAQITNLEIFRDWSHILFKIPFSEKDLLWSSATCIDKLLRKILDRCAERRVGSTTDGHASPHNENLDIILNMYPRIFNHVSTGVYAWGKVSSEVASAPEKAEALVLKLQQVLNETRGKIGDEVDAHSEVGDSHIHLNLELYSALIYCWSQATSHEAASQRALYWFDEMMAEFSTTMKSTVRSKAWNALIRIHIRQKRFHEARLFVDKYSYLNDGYTYVTLVDGWMNTDTPHGRQRAHQSLQEGIRFCLDSRDTPALRQLVFEYLSMHPMVDVFACVQVLKQMISLQGENPALELLETKHFVMVMNYLARNVDDGHRERHKVTMDTITELFQSMVSLYEHEGCLQLKPDYQVLVVVLSAFAKKHDRDSLEQCEALLSKIEQTLLDTYPIDETIGNHSYNVVLDLYTRVPDLLDREKRVKGLLKRMEAASRVHNNVSILPDKISFSALIRAIQQDGKPGYASKIERIVREEMEGSDRPAMWPDEYTYGNVLDAYFRSDDPRMLSWATNLLSRLKGQPKNPTQPNAVMYALLMKIHSKFGSVHGSDSVLSTMIRDFEMGSRRCRPSEIHFLTAMVSWERSGRVDAPDGALRLFHQMMAQYEKGNVSCRPSSKSFGELLVILAKSNHKSKRTIANRLLEIMSRFEIEPNLMMLNFYIRICATIPPESCTQQDRMESWDAALGAFHSLRASKWGANSYTYNSMVNACGNLLGENEKSIKRIDEMCNIFSMCVKDGKVDERVLNSLKRFLPPELYAGLTSRIVEKQDLT